MQELNRLTSERKTFRCKKTRTIKIVEEVDEKPLNNTLIKSKESFIVQPTQKKENKTNTTEDIPNFDFDLSMPVFEKKENNLQKTTSFSDDKKPPPPVNHLIIN
jgi:hypothetical protein